MTSGKRSTTLSWKASIRLRGEKAIVAWDAGKLDGPSELVRAWERACAEMAGGSIAVTPTGPFLNPEDPAEDPTASYVVLSELDGVQVYDLRFSPYRPGPLRASPNRGDVVY
jgi:hypothetical protein